MDTIRSYAAWLLWLWLLGHSDGVLRWTTGKDRSEDTDGGTLRRSKRGWMWNQFFLQEEYMGTEKQYIGKLQSDLDKGDGSVQYILSGEGAGSIFTIEESTGNLHAIKRLDREEKGQYMLRVRAQNKITRQPIEPETEFVVKIHDINDNAPTFTKELYTAGVLEMSPVGTSVTQVTAIDADDSTYGTSAKLVYSLLEGQPYFSVDPETGIIRTALPNLDREKLASYKIVIKAKDMAGQIGGLYSSATVSITLLDVNDNPPRFPQSLSEFSALEATEVGYLVGKVNAIDADVGRNAEVTYSIVEGDGLDMFKITTETATQGGVITVKKPLDYEKKKSYTLKVQAENTYPDPRFLWGDSAKDSTTVRITVRDVDEPPIFEQASYIMEVKEDVAVGTAVGSVTASDHDAIRNPVRYSINRHRDLDRLFSVDPVNGSIFTQKPLDREEAVWHNISVIATELSSQRQNSEASVYIRLLDVNDNAPSFPFLYEAHICEGIKGGQVILNVSATDADAPPGGHKFSFTLDSESAVRTNFSVRDNKDNTASILTRHGGFSRLQKRNYQIPVVITDGDYPRQSSTNTLVVHVCPCDRYYNVESCNLEALSQSAGLSTAALVAILLCIVILLTTVVLFTALRRQRKKEPLIFSKDDVRDNIVSYNDEGGGEEDTQAFDIGTLRHPEAVEESKTRRDIVPEALYLPARCAAAAPARDNADVRNFINQRVHDNDSNPTAPPYDSLATYAYEGSGSIADSLSSLGSASTEGDQDYDYLSEWGPRFRKLAEMYGGEDCRRYS
ncbi:cadherin-6-like [Paramormyrops kingsleyae]|uniref:cadherin-6-like n=1 Tax=Paramormyrops kingsleyae TaxID=1676925 RepID=UPI003B977B2A